MFLVDLAVELRQWRDIDWAALGVDIEGVAEAVVLLTRRGQVRARWYHELSAEAALGGGSWAARRWLGLPELEEGAPADVVAYANDPRRDLAILDAPSRIILRGRVIR